MFNRKPATNPPPADGTGTPAEGACQKPVSTEPARIEHATESLAEGFARLRHRQMIRRDDSALYRDARLVDWMADDARESAAEGLEDDAWSQEEVLRVARSIQASVAAAKCRLRRISGTPELHVPDFPGSAPSVLEDATRAGAAPCLDLAVAAGVGRDLWDEECGSWVRLPPDVPRGSYVALKVAGESMQPLLHPGDTMLVRLEPGVATGDVVVARIDDDGFVVKRVGKVTRASIELLSVNPDFPPVQISRAGQPVVGTVVLCWCDHDLGAKRAAK